MHFSAVRWLSRLSCALPLLAASACGGGSTSPEQTGPAKIDAVSAATLTGVVGSTIATPLAVRVTNQKGAPVSAAAVTFSVTTGNGTVNPTSALTDAAGEAHTTLTLGTNAGTNEVSVSVFGLATRYRFTATGTPGPLA